MHRIIKNIWFYDDIGRFIVVGNYYNNYALLLKIIHKLLIKNDKTDLIPKYLAEKFD